MKIQFCLMNDEKTIENGGKVKKVNRTILLKTFFQLVNKRIS